VNAPFPPAASSLRALALALVRDACRERGSPVLGRDQAASLLERLRGEPPESEAILVEVARRFRLTDGELLAAALCLAAESDPCAARLVAAAQAPVGGSWPLAGFAATLFADFGLDCVALLSGAACRIGLFQFGDEEAPLTERSLQMPPEMVAALSGRRIEPEGVEMLAARPTALPRSLLAEAARRAASLGDARGSSILILRSPCTREGEALAGAVAAALGLECADMGEKHPADHCCWLAATGSLPLLRRSLGPGERSRIDPPGAYEGPIVVLAGSEGLVEAPVPIQEWHVAIPDEEERSELWRAAGLDGKEAERAARTYRQGAGRIAEIAERMKASDLDDPGQRLADAVDSGAGQLDMLARRSRARVERRDLVIPAELGGSLDLLVDRIRLRNRLADDLGSALKARYRPGVRALFTGESGTGKTLAAHWLARRTGLPIYRVDLAAMTSKWIGETEKNLSAVLDAAQHADVVLFFDEADSLFGARTDVGDSNDRFANAQTNFLLQRIEDFDGVAILATNSRDRFDPAFVRRLDSILEFPMPDAAARRALWHAHLGSSHEVGEAGIDALSVAVDLAGGHIRNITLSASVRARRERRPLVLADVAAATCEEYAKLGRSPPALPEC
jgi:ATPase family associated with various cellular activities (AAA)